MNQGNNFGNINEENIYDIDAINNRVRETPPEKDNKKVIIISACAVVTIFIIIIIIVTSSTNKLVCRSSMGNITIKYNKKTLVAYTMSGGVQYDFKTQKKHAEEIGTDNYVKQFSSWFENNTLGYCENK